MSNEVEIKLNKDQYKTLVKLLYFADYCANNGFVTAFNDSTKREKLSSLLEYVYSFGEKVGLPKNISLMTVTSEIPLPEEEKMELLHNAGADLEKIMRVLLSQEFAKKDLKKLIEMLDTPETHLTKLNTILKGSQKYLKEFNENGIDNLRFKLFKKPKSEEDNPDE